MKRANANLILLLVALVWGTTFVAQQLALDHMGPFTYTASRFFLGALVISPLAWREWKTLQHQGVVLDRRDWRDWSGLGLLLFGGISLQQAGLASTTVTNAGFLTALYMPLVPLLAWGLQGQRPSVWTFLAVLGSLAGTWMLSGGQWSAFTEGDFMIMVSILFWAFHVIGVGPVAARKGSPILLAWQQFMVCAVLSLGVGLMVETTSWADLQDARWAILYGGLMSVGLGFTLQVVAQRYTKATDAAIILSGETLFAGLAGALILGERLNWLQASGCGLIFLSIVMVQIMPTTSTSAPAATDPKI